MRTMMQKTPITSFEEAQDYINNIPRFTSKNTMEDTKAFLHRLGDPDRRMRILHVAGTNGKGSVCAYMNAVLRAAGYRVALFTSPHLVDIRERFMVDGEMISREEFLRGFLRVYDLLEFPEPADAEACPQSVSDAQACRSFYHPSYFEYLFFMAMVLFPEKNPDFCILETGLGGRLDATNSVSKKELAVITHISLDHVEYLGDTVEKIAEEKACIMHPEATAVYWDTGASVREVFRRKAAELGVTAYSVSKKDYRFHGFVNKSIDFSVRTEYYNYISLTLHTIASYQMENAALAVRALEVLDGGRTIREPQIRQGIGDCFWAGRMEEVLPEVYVDGAHNEDGIRVFLETVAGDGHAGPRALLFSVVKDKDYESMAEELVGSGLFDRVAAARMQTGRAVSLETLKRLFEQYPEYRCQMYDSVSEAFRELLHSRRQNERVYIAGSLYLAGEIKELLEYDKF